ncbi:hypothetical protein BGW80DRAFT_1161700 [Lactifluus volemus]|nr:hypothetical protein BGW80DRAFT_1161700 [Lactifluus volemus]
MSNLLPNPQTGSANPSASLSALWNYIKPALDHIIRSPTSNLAKAPAVDVDYHMGIHTALYNFFTTQVSGSSVPPPHDTIAASTNHTGTPRSSSRSTAVRPPGYDVYDQLDTYFADVAREVLLAAPTDDSTLVQYLVPSFIRYSTGAQSINRLLNYVNRQFVKRAVDEDKGWLRIGDILSEPVSAAAAAAGEEGAGVHRLDGTASHRKITERMRERRTVELRRWGAPDAGGTAEQLAQAEACAEAASASGRVVPVLSLAYRRFRTEVLEPLLVVPKPKGEEKKKRKGKRKKKGRDDAATSAVGPRGRLARAVKELLESKGGDEEEQNRLASEMADMLMHTGVHGDHPLRRRLRRYCVLHS